MNSKEKYSEVYRTAESLNVNMRILREKSRQLYVWLYVLAYLPVIVYCVLFFITFRDMISQNESYNVIPLTACYIVFLGCYYVAGRHYYQLRLLFDDVKRICGELSDMVDWTTMRKRQVYNTTLDPIIQGAINDFYEYTLSKSCPFYGGRTKFRFLRLVSISGLMTIMIFSVLLMLGVITI